YGLGYVLGVKHGIGNCLVFQYLEEFYPEGVAVFNKMLAKHKIILPKGVCSNLSSSEMDTMISVALGMAPLWENALGENWQSIISPEKLKAIYRKI
ncbi:MAG: alcohol dehydrogenase, partial [Maribacter stanieri]